MSVDISACRQTLDEGITALCGAVEPALRSDAHATAWRMRQSLDALSRVLAEHSPPVELYDNWRTAPDDQAEATAREAVYDYLESLAGGLGNSGNVYKLMGVESERWHVIHNERLMDLLQRARAGEDPDLLYIEEYVNAKRETA